MHKKHLRFRSKKGFSLIEVVAALGLMAMGLLSILAAFSITMRTSERSSKYTEATFLLQRIAEEEKLEGYDTNNSANVAVAFMNYPYTFDVTATADAFSGSVAKKITVKWNEAGKVKTISTDIYVSK